MFSSAVSHDGGGIYHSQRESLLESRRSTIPRGYQRLGCLKVGSTKVQRWLLRLKSAAETRAVRAKLRLRILRSLYFRYRDIETLAALYAKDIMRRA